MFKIYSDCQTGGPPNGTFTPTSESHDQHYAVQVLSRFILAHELAADPAKSTVKKAVMSIMAPGKTWGAVDYDDLGMLKAKDGKYGIIAGAGRDGCVVDAFTEVRSSGVIGYARPLILGSVLQGLAERNPNVSFTHVFPGVIKSNAISKSGFPWYIAVPASLVAALAGSSPASYAEVPFYLIANPEGRALAAKERFWDENVSRLEPHPSAKDEGLRRKIWDHLLDTIDSKK
jgi:hypothetical protein